MTEDKWDNEVTTAAKTRKERRRYIGRRNFNGVLLSGITSSAPMAQSLSRAQERPIKKRPAQRIGRRIVEAATVY